MLKAPWIIAAVAAAALGCSDKDKKAAPADKPAEKLPADAAAAADARLPPLDLAPVADDKMAEARGLNQKGLDAQRAGDFAGAIGHYEAALAADPGHVIARYNLATAHARANDRDSALAILAELGGAADCPVCAGRLARAAVDADFAALRGDAELAELTSAAAVPELSLEQVAAAVLAAMRSTTPDKPGDIPHLHPRNPVVLKITSGQCDGDDCTSESTVYGGAPVRDRAADWFVLEASIGACKGECCAVKTTEKPEGDASFKLETICAKKDSGGVWSVTRLVGIDSP
jgi:tetratricopeptide (TPR) repeat protein